MFRTTAAADADVVELFRFGTERYGLAKADDYVSGLGEALYRLAANPRMARERTEVRPPVRLYTYMAHVIVYIIEDEDVLILRVLHGSSDWINAL